jgi:hypothetical protein
MRLTTTWSDAGTTPFELPENAGRWRSPARIPKAQCLPRRPADTRLDPMLPEVGDRLARNLLHCLHSLRRTIVPNLD